MEYLKEKDPHADVFHLETGARFREFIKDGEKNYSSKLSSDIYVAGGLQPEFLTIWMWGSGFIEKLKEGDHIIIDGTPRKLNEAKVLDSALKFYSREKPCLVFINVSKEWAVERLKSRHRVDDNSRDITRRLEWFETDVVKAIDFYRNNPDYLFLDINGEQTIENVHKEILEKISL